MAGTIINIIVDLSRVAIICLIIFFAGYTMYLLYLKRQKALTYGTSSNNILAKMITLVRALAHNMKK